MVRNAIPAGGIFWLLTQAPWSPLTAVCWSYSHRCRHFFVWFLTTTLATTRTTTTTIITVLVEEKEEEFEFEVSKYSKINSLKTILASLGHCAFLITDRGMSFNVYLQTKQDIIIKAHLSATSKEVGISFSFFVFGTTYSVPFVFTNRLSIVSPIPKHFITTHNTSFSWYQPEWKVLIMFFHMVKGAGRNMSIHMPE